jgi:ABC-type uncharacterized transport system ATPase component
VKGSPRTGAHGRFSVDPDAQRARNAEAPEVENLMGRVAELFAPFRRPLIITASLSVARVLLKNPAVLILDEATSSLDTQSERLVQETLDKAASERTTVAIAHRLSTVVNADVIMVVADGRIVESGTHSQLLSAGGHYADLFNAQHIERNLLD